MANQPEPTRARQWLPKWLSIGGSVLGLVIISSSVLFHFKIIDATRLVDLILTLTIAAFTATLAMATIYLGTETKFLVEESQKEVRRVKESLDAADIHHQERLAPVCTWNRIVSVALAPISGYQIAGYIENSGMGPAFEVQFTFATANGERFDSGTLPVGPRMHQDLIPQNIPSSIVPLSAAWNAGKFTIRYCDTFGNHYETTISDDRIVHTPPTRSSRKLINTD